MFVCLFVFIFNYERSYIFANHILPFVKITVEDQDCPVSLYFKPEKVTSIPEYLGNAPTYFAQTSRTSEAAIGGKNSCERCWKKVPMPRNTAASKIDDDAISLLWQLWCHCNLVHNNFLYLSNPAVAVIFPNLCWWQRTLCSNTGGIDPEKKKPSRHTLNPLFFFNFVLSGFLCGALGRWWNRLLFLAHADDLFYPLFLFGVYTGIGKKTGCYLPLKKREETGPN